MIRMQNNPCGTVLLSHTGEMYVCGYNWSGNLGTGTTHNQRTLEKVESPLLDCVSVSGHTVGVAHDGTVWGCGTNVDNTLGDFPQNFQILTMTQIPNFVDIKSIATGTNSTVLLGNDGQVTIMGRMTTRRFVNITETTSPRILPIPVKIQQISAGVIHCLMLDVKGYVYSYGSCSTDALGREGQECESTLGRIEGLSDIMSISSGIGHNLCLDKYGDVYGFGRNENGQLGASDEVRIKIPLKINSEITKIACGGNYSIFYDTLQNVWVCGSNRYGQLGLDSCPCVKPPQICQNFKGMKIIPGLEHTFAVSPEGDIYSCGRNEAHQCGQPKQQLVNGATNFVKLPYISFKLIHGTKSATSTFTKN